MARAGYRVLDLAAEIALHITSVRFGPLQNTLRTSRLSFIIRHVFHITKDLTAPAIRASSSLSRTTPCSSKTSSLHYFCFKGRDPRRLHPQRRPNSHRQSTPLSFSFQGFRLTSASSMAPSSQYPHLSLVQPPLPLP